MGVDEYALSQIGRGRFAFHEIGPATFERPGPWSFPAKGNDVTDHTRNHSELRQHVPGSLHLAETPKGRGHVRTQALKALIGDRSVVYAIRTPDGLIKVGCSASLWNRRRSLGAAAEILAFRFGDFDDEQAIHRALAEHRARGREYYHPTPAVMAMVNDMRDEWNLPHIAA